MGKVHGERKLSTPATNARKVKTNMPDCGRLGFTSNGFDCKVVFPLAENRVASEVAFFSSEEFSTLPDWVCVGKAASLFEIPPFTLNFYRWIFAWLILAPFTFREIIRKKNYILDNIKLILIL